jgi:hypothetical protein
VIGLASRLKLTVVPVLDDKNHFKGVITTTDLVRYLAGLSSMDQSGGIIVLELIERDYSLSQIAQIVESNNVRILSMYVTSPPDWTEATSPIQIAGFGTRTLSGIIMMSRAGLLRMIRWTVLFRAV